MANAYFRLVKKESEVCLAVIKAADGGESLSADEVRDYLILHGIHYDLKPLTQMIEQANQAKAEETLIPLKTGHFLPADESYLLKISPDYFSAVLRFYAPSPGGGRVSAKEIKDYLNQEKIVYGIKPEAIEEFFSNPCYCTDIVVAEGTPTRQGTDAQIEYFFNTKLDSRPAVNEDGSVDFFNLNSINRCSKGEILARLIPEVHGEPGCDIYGNKIKPKEVRKKILKPTKNAVLNNEKTFMMADVTGHVALVHEQVVVANVFTVVDVNTATGNIDFDGSVMVLGNVYANYGIKATGNIEVKGVVEGAFLECGGDIIIAQGMKGMAKGTLKADGNIISKFLENTRAEAGGSVTTDSILHSVVIAGSEVNVTSKKGFITGGKVCAGKLVQVKNLGSAMGSDTVVEVGVDPTLKVKSQKLQKRISELTKEIKTAQPVINAMAQKMSQGIRLQPDQIKYLQALNTDNKQRTEEVDRMMEELDKVEELLDVTGSASVVVTGNVYGGTQISIGDVSMTVKSSMSYCRFIKLQGDVKMTAI